MEVRKRKLIILTVLATVALTLPVYGALVETGYSGVWDSHTYPYFWDTYLSGAVEGRSNYTQASLTALADGDAYYLDFFYNVSGSRTEWYWWNGVERLYFVLAIDSSTGESVNTWTYIAHEHGSVFNTTETFVGNSRQSLTSGWSNPYASIPTWGLYGEMQIVRLSATTAFVQYNFQVPVTTGWNGEEVGSLWVTRNETYTVSASFWTTCDANLYVGHDGVGTCELYFLKSEVTVVNSAELFHDEQTTTGGSPLSSFDPTGWIKDAFAFLSGLVLSLGGVAKGLVPILPLVLVFWIIDAGVASVQAGSIQPIGALFRIIYEWLAMIWGYLIEAGKLIWDIITFWT